MTTFFGYKGNEHLFPSAEDRGVVCELVDGVLKLRPMSVAEIAARDAKKAATNGSVV